MRIAKTNKKKVGEEPAVKRETHKLDATEQAVGRLATKVAFLLQGKHKPTFRPHIDNGDNVLVSNAAKMKISGKKLEQKLYYHYSGYPGGLKTKKMNEIFSKDPGEVLKRAVWNMMPKNKLRTRMIKRLKINN